MKLPPAGTQGFALPKIARSTFRALTAFSHLVQGAMGDRMKVQGSLAPGYRPYENTTDRQIPIFRLTPAN